MIKHWTRFAGRPYERHISEECRVTLGKKSVIYLNAKAWEALGKPEAVELLFDIGVRMIGLTPTEPWRDNAFPVKDKSGARGKIIHAAAFCTHHKIKATRTIQFNEVHVDAENVMALPLKSVTAIGRGAR